MNAFTRERPAPLDGAFDARPVLDDPELLKAYYAKVSSYERDRLKAAIRSKRLAWTVAACAGALAGVAGLATYGLTPLKGTEVIVLRVNDTTGMVDRVYDVRGGELAASDAERRHWLWQYVRARQSFSPVEAQYNFDVVSLMSTPDVQREYAEWFRGSNPRSPQVVLGRNGAATLSWVSTTFIGPKLAQVRYVVSERKGDLALPRRNMVATVGFDFAASAISGATVNVNPRGFLVTSYHVDQENAE